MASKYVTRLRLAWPLMRLAWRYLDDGDAWRAIDHDVPLSFYGTGCQREFDWYFEGESGVPVETVRQLCDWLAGCEYVRDPELFQVGDFWQHPRTFEQLRRGDCEDHALWAWRKLAELGLEAELVIGQWLTGETRGDGFHVWVVYREAGDSFLLEAVTGDAARMVRPLAEVRAEYLPHFSVDTAFRRRMYAGFVRWLEGRRAQRRAQRGQKAADPID